VLGWRCNPKFLRGTRMNNLLGDHT